MTIRFVTILLVVVVAFVPLAHAQDGGLKTVRIAGNVYMIEGGGGNVGVSVGGDGILMVDDKVSQVGEEVLAALSEFDSGQLRFILNTHFHGDHTGNNALLGHDATIIAQTNVRERLMHSEDDPPMAKEGWPIITFDESVSIHFNDEEIKVFHVQGHTDGDAMVYFTGSKVLHMGDILFSGLFPYVDLEHGGSVDGLLRSLKMVMDEFEPDTPIIAGHGPISTMKDVKASYDMIVATSKLVRERIKGGASLDDLKAAGLPEEFSSFDWSFITTERWITTLYETYK